MLATCTSASAVGWDGKMKKMILLFLISLTAGLAHAAEEKVIYTLVVGDSKMGSLQLKVEEGVEPAFAKYKMTISKKCVKADISKSKSGAPAEKPARWEVIRVDGFGNEQYPKQVCSFNPQWNSKEEAWDAANKELNVRYSVPSERPGPADCSVHNVDTISLSEACP